MSNEKTGSHYAMKRALEAELFKRTGRRIYMPYIRHQGEREKARRLRQREKCGRVPVAGNHGCPSVDVDDSPSQLKET